MKRILITHEFEVEDDADLDNAIASAVASLGEGVHEAFQQNDTLDAESLKEYTAGQVTVQSMELINGRPYKDIDEIGNELFMHPHFIVGNWFTPDHFEDRGFNAEEIESMQDDNSSFADVISTEVYEMAESYRLDND